MMLGIGRRRLILLLGAALGLGACASASTPSNPPAQPAAVAQPPGAPAAPKSLPRLRVSYGAGVGAHAPIILAQRSGDFEQEGLEVDVQRVASASSITALLVGELDLVQVSGPAVVSADLEGGADLIFIAGALDRMLFSLYVPPSVRSGADLRGKAIGTDRPGTPVAFATGLALSRLGVTTNEIQLLPIGTDGLVPGLQSGQIYAGALQLPNSLAAAELGFYPLLNLFDVPYQNIGIILKRSAMERLAPALTPFLRAYRKGMQRFVQDEPWGKEAMATLMGKPDAATVQETYDFYTKQVPFNQNLRVSREGLQGILDSLKDTLPAATTATPEQFYDHRFVDELDQARQ